MPIAKRARLEEFKPDTWGQFAKEIGMSAAFVRQRSRELAGDAVAQARNVAEGLAVSGADSAALTRFASAAGGRAERLLTP